MRHKKQLFIFPAFTSVIGFSNTDNYNVTMIDSVAWKALETFCRVRYAMIGKAFKDTAYAKYYQALMRLGCKVNPRWAVGGQWKRIGNFQFSFLKEQGLLPHHRFLDVGCGCLRGGLHFISYLDVNGYTGMDISPELLAVAKQYIKKQQLTDKNSTLLCNENLYFTEFSNETFDFLLAQSVLSHLPSEDIKECFMHVTNVMHDESVFFATYHQSTNDTCYTPDHANFYYPFEYLQSLGADCQLHIERVEGFNHPRKQQMLRITRAT